MEYNELTEEQKELVKVRYYDNYLYDNFKEGISYGEIANINEIITEDNQDFLDYANSFTYTAEDFGDIDED